MKDRMPDFERKEVLFEGINKELRAVNAYSTGNNLGKHYVNLCKDRSLLNCQTCNLNSVCPNVKLDSPFFDKYGIIDHLIVNDSKIGDTVGNCNGVVVGTDRAGVVVNVNPDPITCRTCVFNENCSGNFRQALDLQL